MQYLTLDSIVRSVLLKEGKPIHYYLQYLTYAVSGLGKLNTTTLKNVNSVKLPVNNYKAITIPCDYVDWVQVGFQVGERVRPMIHDDRLARLNNFDSNGTKIPYAPELPDGTAIYDAGPSLNPSYPDPLVSSLSDAFYEPLFNHPVDRDDWMFNVIQERNEIQLSASFPYAFVVLDYITDGKTSDAATKVDPMAQLCLEKYIRWQAKEHNRTSGGGEAAEAERIFYQEYRNLRAAKNELTRAEIVHAVRSGYSPLPKN